MKKLPYGISNYEELIEDGYYYIDKTKYIEKLEESEPWSWVHKPTSTRVDVALLEINICNGIDNLMLGAYFGTNAKCEPSLRKCYLSQKDIEFTNEMFENLKLNENEREILDKQNALYLDIFNV